MNKSIRVLRLRGMEVGGYRELDLRKGCEYYKGDNVVRLNSGRYGIYHAIKCLGCNKILLPFYQCSTVENFLKDKVEIEYFHINDEFQSVVENRDKKTALCIVNYFGLMKEEYLKKFISENRNVIIDNTQGFFQKNFRGGVSVNSPRKFFGVPDGCYVIGEDIHKFIDMYGQDYSSDTASFLLRRIETGGNNNYNYYLENESRIDESGIRRMSKLTNCLLDGIDYGYVIDKRKFNYDYVHERLGKYNLLSNCLLTRESDQVPMVYPFMSDREDLRFILKENHIYVGQWWKYLLEKSEVSDTEKRFSRYLLPIQIDQRYGKKELDYVIELIKKYLR